MGTVEGPIRGMHWWDNVKLLEVWHEFVWHCRSSDVQNAFHLTEHDKRVRDQFLAEFKRRDITLPPF